MIEAVIRSHLIGDDFIKKNMAKYGNSPAVFYIDAADDRDKAWKKESQLFPRADYVIDWTADHERGVSGSLVVEVWCRNDGKVLPEDCIDPIKSRLSNVFFSDESGIYCTVWNRNYFIDASGSEPSVSGISLTFDIMAFPVHNFNSPDPVQSLQHFIAEEFETMKVVGYHKMSSVFIPTDTVPVVYVRVQSESNARPATHAVIWRRPVLGIHLFCRSITKRSKIVEDISRRIEAVGWSVMDDGSPMRFISESVTINADPLRAGQIQLTAEYGILTTQPSSDRLLDIICQRRT